MSGISVTIGQSAYEWWDLVPAIVGGVIGALAGGIPAYLLAVRSHKVSIEKETTLRHEAERDCAYRLFLILRNVLNDSLVTKRDIDGMLKQPTSAGERYSNQRRISAFANLEFRSRIVLEMRDLTIFKSQKGLDFTAKFQEAIDRYNAVFESLRTYALLKKEHQDYVIEAGQHKVQPNGHVVSTIPAAAQDKISVLDSRLETLIVPTIRDLNELCDDLLILAGVFKERIDDEFNRQMKVPSFSKANLDEFRETLK